MIDAHVHLRDWKLSHKETMRHGLETAAIAGFSLLMDMPNTDPVLTGREAVEQRLEEAEEACAGILADTGRSIAYSLYVGLVDDEDQVRQAVRLHRELFPKVAGLKLFAVHSTGNMGLISRAQRELVYRILAEEDYRGILAVHCEKNELLKPNKWDPETPVSHSLARPPEAESASVAEQITAAGQAGFRGNLHICHISTPEALGLVEDYRRGVNGSKPSFTITCGITPHHALLDTSTKINGNPILLKVNPPLRSPECRKAMYQALLDGRIDWIETDHAPHTVLEKMHGASGIPGFTGYLLLVAKMFRDGAPLELLHKVTRDKVLEVYHLPDNIIPSVSPGKHHMQLKSISNRVHILHEHAIKAALEYPTDPYSKCGLLQGYPVNHSGSYV